MKRKILFVLTMVAFVICLFALTISATPQNYQSYEVELVDGSKITVYETKCWDKYQGHVHLTDATYTEAPVDSEGTYALLDWSQVKVLDFTNVIGHVYNSTTGEHDLMNGINGGYSFYLQKNSFTPANATSLEKIITGKLTLLGGGTCTDLPALKEVVCGSYLTTIQYNTFTRDKKLVNVDFSACTNFTTLGNQAFSDCTGLESITLPNTITSMGDTMFSGCSSLKSLNWPTQITTIPKATFNGCVALSFEIPSNITSIGDNAFRNCDSFVSVTINDNITNIGSYAFRECDLLEELIISENSLVSNKMIGIIMSCPKIETFRMPPLVTEMGYDNFWNCSSLKSVVWPNNLTKISGGNNFANCGALKSIAFPNTITSIRESDNQFAGCSNLEEIRFGVNMKVLGKTSLNLKSLKRVYLPAGIEAIQSNFLGYSNSNDSSKNITFIIAGSLSDAQALQALAKAAAEGTGHEPNACKLYDAVLVSALEYDADNTEPSGFHLVYDYSQCDAFYNSIHTGEAINGCQVVCSRCGNTEIMENPVHDNALNIQMGENGFFSEIVVTSACKNCQAVASENTVAPIFTARGYSRGGAGNAYGVTQKFLMDKKALSDYELYTGIKLEYGVIAAAGANVVSPLVVNEGVVSAVNNKVILSKFTGSEYDYFDIKISNIDAGNLDTSIAMNAYVFDGTNLYYLDDGITSNTAVSVTYNATPVALVPSKEEE